MTTAIRLKKLIFFVIIILTLCGAVLWFLTGYPDQQVPERSLAVFRIVRGNSG